MNEEVVKRVVSGACLFGSVPLLPGANCVALGNQFNLSGPQSSHLANGHKEVGSYFIESGT